MGFWRLDILSFECTYSLSSLLCIFSGELSLGRPWIKLIMMQTPGQLIHLLIMRSAHDVPDMVSFTCSSITQFPFFCCSFPLLNALFQTVKYFNNEAFEANKYDEYLKSKSYSNIPTVAYSGFLLKWFGKKWESACQKCGYKDHYIMWYLCARYHIYSIFITVWKMK